MYPSIPISSGEYSTLLGMNGGQPESPDGKLLVYARKPKLLEAETQLWVCNRDDLSSHRHIFTVKCGNHNGPSATFVNNSMIVFRDNIDHMSAFRIVDVNTGEIVYGPIFGKESHCAENGYYPFSISEEFLEKNPAYPQIDSCGIYTLDIATGEIKRIVTPEEILDMVKRAGYTPTPSTLSMSHVQLNPSATKVMMRLSVEECKIFGALGEIDLDTHTPHLIPDKPVHQLWFDDNTYLATRQYYSDHIEMETSRIRRFSLDGEELETLGGVGNHIDGSPDRQWFVGDRAYPGYPLDILLYKRGNTKETACLASQNFQEITWTHKVHPNPTFSRDGKRVYFNYPVSETKTTAAYVDISNII